MSIEKKIHLVNFHGPYRFHPYLKPKGVSSQILGDTSVASLLYKTDVYIYLKINLIIFLRAYRFHPHLNPSNISSQFSGDIFSELVTVETMYIENNSYST